MFTNRTDLQLERDTLGRFLPWLIAFMVYLSILALAGMLALDDIALRWEKGISDTLTVQLSPQDNGDNRDAIKNEVGKNDTKILSCVCNVHYCVLRCTSCFNMPFIIKDTVKTNTYKY